MDPFYLIKQEILTDAEHADELLETRSDMINDHRGVNIEAFKKLGVQISNEILSMQQILKDIEESIEHVKENPDDFQIEQNEIESRENFCSEMKSKISEIEQKLKDQSNNQKVIFHQSNFNDNNIHDNKSHISQNNQESLMLEDHAEQLNNIQESVNIQLQLAKEINNEFDDQRELIIELDDNITSAEDAMKNVTNQIKGIIEKEGKVPTGLAFALSIVLILLIFLAV